MGKVLLLKLKMNCRCIYIIIIKEIIEVIKVDFDNVEYMVKGWDLLFYVLLIVIILVISQVLGCIV